MKRALVLSMIFLFALMLFSPEADAFPTQAYVCLYIPAFGEPSVFPIAVIGIGENVGILQDINMYYIPALAIGIKGFFVTSFGEIGYCDKDVFFGIYKTQEDIPVLQIGISITALFRKNGDGDNGNEGDEERDQITIWFWFSRPDQPNSWVISNNPEKYLINPGLTLPAKEDLQALKLSLLEAHSLYPQYKELLDIALAFIDL